MRGGGHRQPVLKERKIARLQTHQLFCKLRESRESPSGKRDKANAERKAKANVDERYSDEIDEPATRRPPKADPDDDEKAGLHHNPLPQLRWGHVFHVLCRMAHCCILIPAI